MIIAKKKKKKSQTSHKGEVLIKTSQTIHKGQTTLISKYRLNILAQVNTVNIETI